MAWIEAHQELRNHPKTKKAARLLGVSRPQLIGHLFCLWWWCLDYSANGNLSAFDNADIADGAEWDGDPDRFVQSLIECGPSDRPGFLFDNGNGLEVKDWCDYGGKYITKRDQGRERQRTFRTKKRQSNADVTDGNVSVTDSNALLTRHTSVSNAPIGEESIVKKRTEDMSRVEEEERLPAPATAPKAVDPEFQERTQMTSQYQAVLGAPSTAIYPEMIRYMTQLQVRDSVAWWSLALTETTTARRPGWHYMKAILESWLAAGKPTPNGKDDAKQKPDKTRNVAMEMLKREGLWQPEQPR